MSTNFNHLLTFNINKLIIPLTDADLRNIELHYRGEGNSNLVMNIPDIKYVLRFIKSKTAVNPEYRKDYMKIAFTFHYIIVKNVFSTMYSTLPVFIETSLFKARNLDELVFAARPENRKHKRISCNVAEMYPDFAFFPIYDKYSQMPSNSCLKQAPETDYLQHFFSEDYITFRNFSFSLLTDDKLRKSIASFENERKKDTWCVEIKPKRGWIPYPDRQEMCIFCMNQFYKLETHRIDTRSHYCPMDLFSGDLSRMQHAIKELLNAPQNNLRIFKNGEFVFGETSQESAQHILSSWFEDDSSERCVNNFCHLLTKILLYESPSEDHIPSFLKETTVTADLSEFSDQKQSAQVLSSCQSKCHLENSKLPKTSILNRILSLQMLDTAGLQATADFYQNHKNEYSSEFGYVNDLCANAEFVNGELQIPKLNPPEAYALATMANDLSILITTKVSDQKDAKVSSFVIEDLRNVNYEVKVSVVDVNPKTIFCIEKHVKRNKNLLNAFLKFKEKIQ